MGQRSDELSLHRNQLTQELEKGDDYLTGHWAQLDPLMNRWWTAYKNWEANDKFNRAFTDSRMSVRTFPGGDIVKDEQTPFEKQVQKTFPMGSISVASWNKKARETEVRVFADSQYTRLDPQALKEHDRIFHKTDEHDKYGARRGIDTSAFSNPANFVSREKKYAEGLHDLSASLLNPGLSIFDQIHNDDDGMKANTEGAHFAFVPLSKEEDQLMLYKLIQYAKRLRLMLPGLQERVRSYRAEMTRVKLANEFDMAVVYTAVPVAKGRGGPAYKLRYGLGKSTTVAGDDSLTTPVTPQIYAARQEAARSFKSIIGIRNAKNEIVIALRKHAGPFPVYAVRKGNELLCYKIVTNKMEPDGRKISANGVMTGG
jgi:hypothetical protein